MENLEKNYSVLIQTDAENLQDEINSAVKNFVDFNFDLMYISLNKPFKTIGKIFDKNHIKTDRIKFVDCIAPTENLDSNIIYLNISDIGKLSITISDYFLKLKNSDKKDVVVIDAVHTLWIYHKPNVIAKFIQSATENSFLWKGNIVSFIADIEDKILLRRITPFFDRLIIKNEI